MMQARLWAIFILDTSCIVTLDGLDRPPSASLSYADDEQDQIWTGLEDLCRNQRLKIIKQVKEELSRWDPGALERFKRIPFHRMPRVNNDLRIRYQRLVAAYPNLIPRDPSHDPADPCIVVSAQQYAMTVITDELPRSVRRGRVRRGPPIPDLCDEVGVPWTSLRELSRAQGWI